MPPEPPSAGPDGPRAVSAASATANPDEAAARASAVSPGGEGAGAASAGKNRRHSDPAAAPDAGLGAFRDYWLGGGTTAAVARAGSAGESKKFDLWGDPPPPAAATAAVGEEGPAAAESADFRGGNHSPPTAFSDGSRELAQAMPVDFASPDQPLPRERPDTGDENNRDARSSERQGPRNARQSARHANGGNDGVAAFFPHMGGPLEAAAPADSLRDAARGTAPETLAAELARAVNARGTRRNGPGPHPAENDSAAAENDSAAAENAAKGSTISSMDASGDLSSFAAQAPAPHHQNGASAEEGSPAAASATASCENLQASNTPTGGSGTTARADATAAEDVTGGNAASAQAAAPGGGALSRWAQGSVVAPASSIHSFFTRVTEVAASSVTAAAAAGQAATSLVPQGLPATDPSGESQRLRAELEALQKEAEAIEYRRSFAEERAKLLKAELQAIDKEVAGLKDVNKELMGKNNALTHQLKSVTAQRDEAERQLADYVSPKAHDAAVRDFADTVRRIELREAEANERAAAAGALNARLEADVEKLNYTLADERRKFKQSRFYSKAQEAAVAAPYVARMNELEMQITILAKDLAKSRSAENERDELLAKIADLEQKCSNSNNEIVDYERRLEEAEKLLEQQLMAKRIDEENQDLKARLNKVEAELQRQTALLRSEQLKVARLMARTSREPQSTHENPAKEAPGQHKVATSVADTVHQVLEKLTQSPAAQLRPSSAFNWMNENTSRANATTAEKSDGVSSSTQIIIPGHLDEDGIRLRAELEQLRPSGI